MGKYQPKMTGFKGAAYNNRKTKYSIILYNKRSAVARVSQKLDGTESETAVSPYT
jgi:hypothetical protein